MVINTDAHYLEQFNYMLLGVLTARRELAQSPDILIPGAGGIIRLLRAKSSK